MPTLQEMREQRAAASVRMTELARRINDEKRGFKADEQQDWDRASADYDRLGTAIQIEQRAEQARKEQERPAGDPLIGREGRDGGGAKKGRRERRAAATEEQKGLALRAWAKNQYGLTLKRAERQACQALSFDPRSAQLTIRLWDDTHRNDVRSRLAGASAEGRARIMAESRANLSAQIGTSGGYLVAPGTLSAAFELNLLAFGGVRQVADEMTTTSGEPFVWPTVDDAANKGALLAENTSIGNGVNPLLGQKTWWAYKFTSTPVLIPSELLEDDNYNIAERLGDMLGTRLGRGIAPYLATGTGNSQPTGIVQDAAAGITTASSTAIKFEELVQLQHKVDPAYRSMGCGWLMHDLILSYIRQIKDGNGRPLFLGESYQSGMADGKVDRILGWPINICQEMASAITTGQVTILGGLLSKYKIRRVRDVRMYRLVERYRDLDQDGFVAFQREDGKLLDAGTGPVRKLTQL